VTRHDILVAAQRVAEREGLARLTMRRLAADLGVAPNALYTYFPNKGALLDALLDTVLARVRMPRTVHESSWRAELSALMRRSRRTLVTHPELLPLFIRRPGGRSALRLGEATLQLLVAGGLRGRRAVEALRALLAYTLGFAAVEVPRATDPARRERVTRARERIASLPAAEYPATKALARRLAQHPTERDFEAGLAWLLGGLAGAHGRVLRSRSRAGLRRC
jgi:TetR/AcrR family tetracycline transcriptional repressor